MTLLYITNGINGSGGLERVLSIKASYLVDKLNYNVHILVLNNADKNPFYSYNDRINFHSIQVQGNVLNYFLQYRSGIKKILQEVQPDVISVCDDGFKGMMFPVIFNNKTPVIYERHASFDIFKRENKLSLLQRIKLQISKSIIQWGASRFDRFVILTSNNQREWNLPNMQVIPNPLSFYPVESANLLNKKVIAVGSNSYIKGFDRLLFSWNEVVKKYPEWQLEIYGNKDPKKKLEKLITAYDLINNVKLFNPVANIQEKYLDASIYALSSRSEGFGMVLIEAMACGLPCVAYDCPSGPKDIISHKKDGILVENGNVDDFSNALMELIVNHNKRIEMGKLAKENVQRYLPENILPQWDELINNLL